MKVALHLSGQQRYRENFKHLLQEIGQYDQVDIYCWHWTGPRENSEIRAILEANSPSNVRVAEIQQVDQIDFAVPQDWTLLHPVGSSIFNLMSMTYAIRECDRMREGKYDLAIRCRPDLRLNGFKPIDVADGRISVGLRPKWLPSDNREIQDQVAIGKPKTIETYSKLYDDLPKYHEAGFKYHPESYFHWYLTNQGIEFEQFGYEPQIENYHLPRTDRAIF